MSELVTAYSIFTAGVSSAEDRDLAPVIAVRSSTESWDTWQDIYEDIALKTRRKVFTVSVRIPEEGELKDDADIEYRNDWLNRFIEERNISRAVLIGHSSAAYMVLPQAYERPEKVEKLIVADIWPRDLCQRLCNSAYRFFSFMKESVSSIPAGADEDTAKKAMKDYLLSKIPEFEEVLNEMFEADMPPLICKNGVYQWDESIDIITSEFDVPDNAPELYGFEGPVLFVNGEESDIIAYEDRDVIFKFFPKARLCDTEGVNLFKEEETRQMHKQFLEEVVKFLNE